MLVTGEDGNERCVSCLMCMFVCPPQAIYIEAEETQLDKERRPKTFDIDFGRCIFCGYCEEACPEIAIVLKDDFELASFLLSVLGEGTFLNLLAFLRRHAPDSCTQEIMRLAAADEARHVAFGMGHLLYRGERDPGLLDRLAMAIEEDDRCVSGADRERAYPDQRQRDQCASPNCPSRLTVGVAHEPPCGVVLASAAVSRKLSK